MNRKSISNYCILSIAIFLLFSCEKARKDSTETSTDTKSTDLVAPANSSNTWIDSSEAQNLSNTWVDEEDKGELTNTWAEDAFSSELSTSSSSNSWVDEDGETIYKKTEVPPEFVGGKDALFKYINDNIKYPEVVQRGNVYIAFVITKEGAVRDARIVKGINENCDKEALRLINNMPAWDPGMEKGKIVSSVYGLPIIFRP